MNTKMLNMVCRRTWNDYTWTQVTALNLACYSNQEQLALLLLEHGNPDPTILCERHNPSGHVVSSPALWWAASHNLAPLCSSLLKHGANPDIGEDPLKEAKTEEIRTMITEKKMVQVLSISMSKLL